MSLASQMLAATKEAQSRLAEIGGAAAGALNSLYNAESFLAVYGQPVVQRTMLPSGGYRQRTFLQVTVTREQFNSPPTANLPWVRTDLEPNIIYRIEKVDQHDPYVYVLTVVRVGE